LPKHPQGWKDYFTGKHYDGGQTIHLPATLEHIPVFKKN
jgi:alpha-glucosidase